MISMTGTKLFLLWELNELGNYYTTTTFNTVNLAITMFSIFTLHHVLQPRRLRGNEVLEVNQ